MKILHITPHLGGGVGTVIMDWMENIQNIDGPLPRIACLDYANEKAKEKARKIYGGWLPLRERMMLREDHLAIEAEISDADIVLVHYWGHPMLAELFSKPIPDCRMAFWCHRKDDIPNKEVKFPDRFINTSPIQDKGIWGEPMEYIWSTGNMERFLKLKPIKHEGFNIGTVASKKLHKNTLSMFEKIRLAIPKSRLTIVGDLLILGNKKIIEPPWVDPDSNTNFTGKVDDVAPYLAEMDVFVYPLRSDHYGTCEIALGEAMAAGVMPVVMDNPVENFIVTHGLPIARDEQQFIDLVVFYYHCKNGDRHVAWESMKERAKNRAKQLYSIDNMIASWNEVFESMMRNPKTKKEPI